MEQVLRLAVVFFAALATGGLMVTWIGLGRAMSRLSVSTYVEFHQATNHTFDPYMPIVVVGAILSGIVVAILSQGIHSLSGELAIAGSACYGAVLTIALSTNVPDQQTDRALVSAEAARPRGAHSRPLASISHCPHKRSWLTSPLR
jgi:hypothetical protein